MTNHRLAGLEHEARRPRLATEADVEPDTKTRKRTEDTSAADRVKNWDSSSTRVDDGQTSLTSFGIIAEPLLKAPEKYLGDALVNKGAEVPKPHLPPMEVSIPSYAADGLLSSGTVSTSMRAIFPQPLFSWRLGEETKERTGQANLNQVAPSSWRKVIQTKSRQFLVFDTG